MSLEKLLANAEYLYPKENVKPDKKPNVAKYHYFKTDVKIGDKIYQVIFDTEEYKNEKSSPSANVLRSVKNLDEDTNSITDNKENLNPKTVHLYNISEKKKSNIFYQSAYHGTPHRFDEFSLEYIGTGEGAKAHGWGLYFAGNKDVSEGYRKRLAQSLKNAKYDGVPLSKTELTKLHPAISEKLYLKGKDEALKELELLRKQSEKNKDKEGFLGRSSREFLENYNEQLELLNSVDESKITGVNKGQLYEVDIPEDDVLLEEYEPLSGQSDKVINSIKKLYSDLFNIKDFSNNNIDRELGNLSPKDDKYKLLSDFRYDDTVAKDFYKHLSKFLNSEKKASLKLNEYGIKGIKYDGRQDGECYVIFDDKAVKILDKFYQDEERAKIEFKEQETIITLAKSNDASSFMHELAHLYLHDLQELAKVNKRAQKDLQEVYDILGFDSSKDYSEDEFREMHEKFARSFEAYLLNGQAPTEKMKGIFERFKEFLQQIYESLVDLDVEFSNEVKQCFDRLLTTDEEYEKEVLPIVHIYRLYSLSF